GPRLWLAQAEYREQTDTREDCVGGKAENQSRSADQSLYQSECDSEQPHRQDFRRPTDQTCFLHEFRLTASARLRNNDRCAKRTQARTARIDAPIRRNNCAPLETISNFFINPFC